MYSLPSNCTFAALTIASAASTAPTKPLVSTIPSASRGISASSLLKILEVKKQADCPLKLSPHALRIKRGNNSNRVKFDTLVGGRYSAPQELQPVSKQVTDKAGWHWFKRLKSFVSPRKLRAG